MCAAGATSMLVYRGFCDAEVGSVGDRQMVSRILAPEILRGRELMALKEKRELP